MPKYCGELRPEAINSLLCHLRTGMICDVFNNPVAFGIKDFFEVSNGISMNHFF